jgi:hypothetical protein
VVVVGNKSDKAKAREVNVLEASRFAQENGKQQRYPAILDSLCA